METQRTDFNWTAWYATIPGIPNDWGQAPVAPAGGRTTRIAGCAVRLPRRPGRGRSLAA